MKKLSPEEKEKLQQKVREYHESIRVAREAEQIANRSDISILVVILSAGVAVGLLVFMWQFLMDTSARRPFWFLFFVTIIARIFWPVAFALWWFTDPRLNQLWRVILGFSLSTVKAQKEAIYVAISNSHTRLLHV